LKGNTHPLALPKYDQSPVPDSMPMRQMFLQLQRTADQEKALDSLLTSMPTPSSSNYHQWLTAEQLGLQYGPAQKDIDTVVSWLGSHGLQVNGVSGIGFTVDVSGTAGQLRDAFHTEIHRYTINGKQYIANASDPEIPAALAPLVGGFNSLNSVLQSRC
jgi:subtilase family serine protease